MKTVTDVSKHKVGSAMVKAINRSIGWNWDFLSVYGWSATLPRGTKARGCHSRSMSEPYWRLH